MNTLAKSPTPWKLAWSDDFNYEGAPDPSKWWLEEGFLRNGEMQYYTGRQENARVKNGMLVIEGRKERLPNTKFKPGSERWMEIREYADFTAASLRSKLRINPGNSRVEVLAKLPKGRGVWPAIWTLGVNLPEVSWPACGEIDILEFVGNWPGEIFGTLHYNANGIHEKQEGVLRDVNPHDHFHTYAIEWKSDRIEFFFDAECYHTAWIDSAGIGEGNPFRQPHELLLNLALGGSLGGEIDETCFPQEYLIKHVRVYELAGQD